jgi:hypothetical protein
MTHFDDYDVDDDDYDDDGGDDDEVNGRRGTNDAPSPIPRRLEGGANSPSSRDGRYGTWDDAKWEGNDRPSRDDEWARTNSSLVVGHSDALETACEEGDGGVEGGGMDDIDDDGGGEAKAEEIAHTSPRSPRGTTTNDGVDGEDDIIAATTPPTMFMTERTTTYNIGDIVASSSSSSSMMMMISLNLSEINNVSADERDERTSRGRPNATIEYDDDERIPSMAGTTSCVGKAAMVSMSLSEIASTDENNRDDAAYDDDDEEADEADAGGGGEGGCAAIFDCSPSSVGPHIDDDVVAIDPVEVDLAREYAEDGTADASTFARIISEDVVRRPLDSERTGNISHVPSAPQCNGGGMLDGTMTNDADGRCNRGGDDVHRIAEVETTHRLDPGDDIVPASAPRCNEGGAIERRWIRGDNDDDVVADGETTMQIGANVPFQPAEVWGGNDGIVVRDSLCKPLSREDDFSTMELKAECAGKDELGQLVERGDWNAAIRFLNASDLGSLNDLRRSDTERVECERPHVRMDDAVDLSATGKIDADHVARDSKVGFIVNIGGLYCDDKTNDDRNIVGEWPSSIPRSPSFGSMPSNGVDASTDDSQSSHSEARDVLAGMDENLPSYQPTIDRPRRATTLSECLAAVQDYLLQSTDGNAGVVKEELTINDPFARLFARDRKSEVEEELSPRDQLILKYPCHAGVADDEVRLYWTNFVSILFGLSIPLSSYTHRDVSVPQTTHASDVDGDESHKSELKQTKSELNVLIDEIAAVSLEVK